MKSMTLQMDERTLSAEPGQTLLEVAHSAGIDIPTLCHDERVKVQGACRMCLVEIEKHGRKQLVASCVYEVEPGLVVRTCTPEIQRLRRLIIELVWPAWLGRAKEYGLTSSRFVPATPDCSQCGLCVRYCAEVTGKNAVYFKGRGIDRRVAFVPGMSGECASCRACFEVCTGGWLLNHHGPSDEADPAFVVGAAS